MFPDTFIHIFSVHRDMRLDTFAISWKLPFLLNEELKGVPAHGQEEAFIDIRRKKTHLQASVVGKIVADM